MQVIKESGEKEKYSSEKFCQSLKDSGIPDPLVDKTCTTIEKNIKPGTKTEEIYKETRKILAKENRIYAEKYSLKRAIMGLGPAGFHFEKYFAAILKEYGYKTETNLIMEGYCTQHEVDILAEKSNKHFIIEMKYHNTGVNKTDIQDVMYAYGRFLDIKDHHEKKLKEKHKHKCWAATNTKLTKKAIEYGECKKINMTSWSYPKNKSLKKMIEKKHLYPVTLIPSITRNERKRISEKNIFFAKDLIYFSPEDFYMKFDIDQKKAKKIHEEAQLLIQE